MKFGIGVLIVKLITPTSQEADKRQRRLHLKHTILSEDLLPKLNLANPAFQPDKNASKFSPMFGENFGTHSSQLFENALNPLIMARENSGIHSPQLAKNALQLSAMVGENFGTLSSQKNALVIYGFLIQGMFNGMHFKGFQGTPNSSRGISRGKLFKGSSRVFKECAGPSITIQAR